ncbi:hypothetical protein [Nostoc sp. ChiSLP03a]|nr:hypothetical protein [Nostoc sp. ChiSLP03a]MDZ8215474.1 hypothetical protein [Nostoc sp. ChiSLP03a]
MISKRCDGLIVDEGVGVALPKNFPVEAPCHPIEWQFQVTRECDIKK